MFDQNEAIFQIFKQPGIRQNPAVPSGVLVPGEASWNAKQARNKLENNQVQSDGMKRKSGKGNKTSSAGGTIIYNLNLLGYWLNALCDGLTSAAFGGVLSVTITSPGSGYTSAPTVEIAGTTGDDAEAVAIVVGGQIEAVVITNHGTGYTGPLTVTFTGGAGTGAAATAVLDATKYIHTGAISVGSPFYHLIEKGVAGQALFRRYYDSVLRKLSFSDSTEGISSLTDEWVGSGQVTKNATSLDATPSEVAGEPAEYANLCLLEGNIAGVLMDLSMDIESSLVEKRPPLAIDGKATEIRRGGWTVSGSGNAWFDNEDLLAKAEEGTLTSFKSVLTSPDGAFIRNLPEVEIDVTDWERSDNGLLVPINFASVKHAAATSTVEFALVNDTASYPT